jgi:hypothetical protein
MKRAGLALFVIFYLAATINAAGQRSGHMAGIAEHAVETEFGGVESPAQSFVKHLPRFSHAQKIKPEIVDTSRDLTDLPRPAVQYFEDSVPVENSTTSACETQRFRAPPARA